jgi:putative tricarboxylic transport membrane protein
MALDRWIAFIFLLVCMIYGYTAYFTMDGSLPPFMQRNPIWPSTLPKLLTILGIAAGLLVLFSKPSEPSDDGIDYRRLRDYAIGKALFLMALMVVYAIALRPVGFLIATSVFLAAGGFVLGERKLHWLILIAITAAGSIWFLVQEVLGIFLRPLPSFMGV